MGVVTISGVRDAAYYEEYAALGGPPPRWLGAAPEAALGLARPPRTSVHDAEGRVVERGDLLSLLEGTHPETGAPLLARARRDRRAGFDLTFSPPKSVSLLALVAGDPAVADACWAAHRAAVEAAFAWMQQELFVGRRGHGGRDGVVHGTVAAVAYDHATSRSDDPQMHSHVVLANLCWGEDGRVTSLWADAFWRGRGAREHIVGTLSALYGAALRAELSARLGVAWTAPIGRDGHREVAGVPARAVREFSRRRRDVLGATALAGDSGPARQAAMLASRTAKTERPAAELAGEWRDRLASLGLAPGDLAAGVARARRRARSGRREAAGMPAVPAVMRLLHGPGGRPTWTLHDLVGALARLAPAGATPATLEAWAAEVLASGDVVPVSSVSSVSSADDDARDEGRDEAAHRPAGASRWCWRMLWEAEAAAVEAASTERRDAAPAEVVEAVIARAGAAGEQAEAIRALAGGRFVGVLEAAAASGKTWVLGEVGKAWRGAGCEVRGLGPSWRAALELEAVGIPATAVGAGELSDAVPVGGVVIVDEAAMMPTLALAEVLTLARGRGARVVLAGDPRQLASVEAGGLAAMLARRCGAVQLTENRRQEPAWLVGALADLRRGAAERAVDALAEHGDVVLAASPEDAATRLVGDWLEARRGGVETTILVSTRAERDGLNALAQAALVGAGGLGPEVGRLDASSEHDGLPERVVHIGDEVRFRRRRVWPGGARAANGTAAVVVAGTRRRLSLRLPGGEVVEVGVGWASDHLDLGYASTVHAAQGATIGTAAARRRVGAPARRGEAFVLGGGQGLEAAYVALSRATDRTRVYLTAGESPSETGPHAFDRQGMSAEDDPADPLARARRAWAEPSAPLSAAAERDRAERVASLVRLGRPGLEARRDAAVAALGAGVGDPTADLVSLRTEVDELDEALGAARRAQVEAAALEAARGEGWGRVLGPPPAERAARLRWREAVGALVDAEHWVVEARRASASPATQAAAERSADDVAAVVAAARRAPRRLDELVATERIESLRAEVVGLGGAAAERAVETPAADRLLAAAAWLDVDVTEAWREAERMGGGEAAYAHRLRVRCAEALAGRPDAPAAVVAATLPGYTLPALAASLEAARLAGGLDEEAGRPVAADPWAALEALERSQRRETVGAARLGHEQEDERWAEQQRWTEQRTLS